MTGQQSRLAVLVDGVALPDDEARALWTKFSEHMDQHKGDMAGFAKLCGYARVSPEARNGQAVLLIQTTEGAAASPPPKPQKEAQNARPAGAPRREGGGSRRPKRRR